MSKTPCDRFKLLPGSRGDQSVRGSALLPLDETREVPNGAEARDPRARQELQSKATFTPRGASESFLQLLSENGLDEQSIVDAVAQIDPLPRPFEPRPGYRPAPEPEGKPRLLTVVPIARGSERHAGKNLIFLVEAANSDGLDHQT